MNTTTTTITTTATATATTRFNPDTEINKLLKSLDPEEKNIEKMSDVTHKCLLIMSVRYAATVINFKKNNGKKLGKEEEDKLFNELINKHYSEKIKLMEEELLN